MIRAFVFNENFNFKWKNEYHKEELINWIRVSFNLLLWKDNRAIGGGLKKTNELIKFRPRLKAEETDGLFYLKGSPQ